MKDLFTIIIPTRNRHQYLTRSLDYYSSIQDIHVIVCDSSPEKYPHEIPAIIQYVHLPGNTFAQKLALISDLVKTPYVLMCADDDFMTMEGIEKSVEFLEANKDYSSAQGNYIAFYFISGVIHYLPLYTTGVGVDINEDDPKLRISRYFGSGVQMYYCVHRIENFRQIFKSSAEKILNLNLMEYYIGLSTLIAGKHKVLPVFYSCRELLYNSSGKSAGINELSINPKFAKEYGIFFDQISELLAQIANIGIVAAGEIIEAEVKKYVDSSRSKEFYKKRKRSGIIQKIIPTSIRRGLSKTLFSMNKSKNIQKNIDFANTHSGFPFNNEEGKKELDQIKSFILKHNIHQ